jgi:nitronate monooxygenase
MFHPADLAEPIVQAPLAGGPSTPELAIAVCEAGGLGFVAAGYRTADAVADQIDAVAAATSRPFGVNVFVPAPGPADPDAVSAYLEELEAEALLQGAEVGEPRFEDDDWERKLGVICDRGVAVASFVFGCPEAAVVARLQNAGVAAWVTVTDPREAELARDAGADALVVQGSEAGGHRGGFDDVDPSGGTGLLALLRIVAAAVALPMVAAGGIADGAAVAAVLCAGASAAQVGTALMLAPEAGTHESQRALLAQRAPTKLTRAFTGRLGRGIVNRFLEQRTPTAPSAYPEIHHATSPIRAAARQRGDVGSFNLWAGQAHELARNRPAGEIVREMGADCRRVLRELDQRLS